MISVLMPVYNGQKYLPEALDSILNQTYRHFELVVVDDGSTDATIKILRSYNDPRLKIIAGMHLGLTAALNEGARHCRGRLLARMDADDIADPGRLQAQWDYLNKHPAIGLVCTDAGLINQAGAVVGVHRMGRWNDDILREALLLRRRAMPIIHPSVMMRREVFSRLGGYRDYVCAEDHDFWLRALEEFRFGHIAQTLLRYRIHPDGVSRSRRLTQMASGLLSVVAYLVKARMDVDVFVAARSLLDLHFAKLESYLARNILPVEAGYREVRELIRDRQWALSIWKGAQTFHKYGTRVLPSKQTRSLYCLAEDTANCIMTELRHWQPGEIYQQPLQKRV